MRDIRTMVEIVQSLGASPHNGPFSAGVQHPDIMDVVTDHLELMVGGIVDRTLGVQCEEQTGRGLRSAPYFNELLIDENLVFNVVPIPSTAALITNAMPVATRQYSIAVAPDSSERNARTVFMLSTYRASLSVG
jgi:hypothetical protein